MIYKTQEDILQARHLVSHPGETLHDTIFALGINQSDLAKRMNRPIKTINEIIQGKAAITPETALQLEKVLGLSAEFWIARESNYRLVLAEIQEAEEMLQKLEWVKEFPLNDMLKLQWVSFDHNNVLSKLDSILRYFGVSEIVAYEQTYCADQKYVHYRMSKQSKNMHSINAWLRQGELQAIKIKSPEYNQALFKESLNEIKSLMISSQEDFFSVLQVICLEAGVKVVYTPCLKNTQLFGSTRWINNCPVIQLSNQYKRDDLFWFTFFHEAGHIIKHGKKDIFVEGLEYTEEGKMKEDEADKFAINYTFTEGQEELFFSECMAAYNNPDVIREFAASINTLPSFIVGRLARKKLLPDSFGWSSKIYKKIESFD